MFPAVKCKTPRNENGPEPNAAREICGSSRIRVERVYYMYTVRRKTYARFSATAHDRPQLKINSNNRDLLRASRTDSDGTTRFVVERRLITRVPSRLRDLRLKTRSIKT